MFNRSETVHHCTRALDCGKMFFLCSRTCFWCTLFWSLATYNQINFEVCSTKVGLPISYHIYLKYLDPSISCPTCPKPVDVTLSCWIGGKQCKSLHTGFQVPSMEKVGIQWDSKSWKSRAKIGISIMKSRDSKDILSVFRPRKRYNKQTKISLNNNTTLPWKGNTKINIPKKELQLK